MEEKKKSKLSLILGILAGIALLSLIAVLAVQKSLIGTERAEEIALADAGLSADQVSALRTKLLSEDGSMVYEVSFYCDGTEYEYTLLAKNGEIAARDIDPEQQVSPQTEPATQGTVQTVPETLSEPVPKPTETTAPETAPLPTDTADIGIAAAKQIALADAGLTEADVTFVRTAPDGRYYDVEFCTADTEYDYEISRTDGSIREKESKALPTPPAGVTYIGNDKARELALQAAGFTEADVLFLEVKLDADDRRPNYDVEFLVGNNEYSFEIDAVTGEILKQETEVEHDMH